MQFWKVASVASFGCFRLIHGGWALNSSRQVLVQHAMKQMLSGFAPLKRSLTRVNRSLFHKTQRVLPRVFGVKGSLALGTHRDATARRFMNILRRETL